MSKLAPERIDRIVKSSTQRIEKALRKELGQLEATATSPRTPAALAHAARALRDATGQADTLRGLLAAAGQLGARAVMFVVRGDALEGWDGVGFEDDPGLENGLRGVRIEAADAAAQLVLETCRPVGTATGSDIPVPDFGQSIRGEALLVPLLVQDRTAGILYADPSSAENPVDRAGLETLVELTAISIERNVLARAQAQAAAAATSAAPAPAAAPTARPKAAAAPAPAPAAAAAPAPAAASEPAAPPAPPRAADLPTPSDPECADALRFARLLMEEICLYNGDKVEEGRSAKDIGSRLSDEIRRARTMYDERITPDVRAQGDFFDQAVVAVLGGGDAATIGAMAAAES